MAQSFAEELALEILPTGTIGLTTVVEASDESIDGSNYCTGLSLREEEQVLSRNPLTIRTPSGVNPNSHTITNNLNIITINSDEKGN